MLLLLVLLLLLLLVVVAVVHPLHVLTLSLLFSQEFNSSGCMAHAWYDCR